MLNTRTFLRFLLVIIASGVFFGSYWNQARFEFSQPLYADGDVERSAAINAGRERLWRQPISRSLWRIGEDTETLIYDPQDLEIDRRGHVFIVDGGDLSVKEFSTDGRLVRRYGQGKGQGPGEFSSITGLDTTRDGEVWISDLTNGAISVFDLGGDLVRTLRTERRPYRVVSRSAGDFVLMLPFNSPHLFERFSADGKFEDDFGALLERQVANSMALDGWITRDDRGGFVYAGHYVGLLAGYTFDGDQRFLVRTIDPVPLPKVVSNKEGRIWVDREALTSTWSVSAAAGEIHLYARVKDGFRSFGAIDTYSLDSGAYLYSRRLPEYCIWAVVTEQHVYTGDETGVTKWARDDAAAAGESV